MHAIFSRRVVVFGSITKLLKKKPTLSSYPSQNRHFLSHLLPSGFSASSSVTHFVPNLLSRSEKLHGFCASTLRNANLKLKFGNVLESRAGFFDSQLLNPGFESKGFQNRGWKSWFNGANGVVFGLIIANVAVFTMWKVSDTRWMANNFLLTVPSFMTGRIHNLITSGFSNYTISQITMNIAGLYYFGTRIANTLGPVYLLKLYFAGALGSSVVFLSHHALMTTTFKSILPRDDKREKRTTKPIIQGHGVVTRDQSKPFPLNLGAEGSVFAIALLDTFLYPKVTTYFELMLRVPVMLGILFLGTDMLKMLEGKRNNMSHNLLGGAVVGVMACARIRKGRFHF